MVRDAQNLSRTLLRLADDKVEDRKREMSIATHYPYVTSVFPSKMIMPLQDALTCTLPSSSDTVQIHNPFPGALVEIKGKPYFTLAIWNELTWVIQALKIKST
jgi:serine/threonine-protein kinase ATR